MESSQLSSHMQQKIAPVETPVQGTPPKSGNEGLTKAFSTVISEYTEIYEIPGTPPTKVRPPLGRDGHALGDQPHGGPDSCAALPFRKTAQRGADCGNAQRGAIQRQHQPQGLAGVEDRQTRSYSGRQTRSFRVDERCLVDVSRRPGRAETTRD